VHIRSIDVYKSLTSIHTAGGGIHGVCTAYYLAKMGVRSLIVEQTSIAAAASGKSGGFLGRDWGSGPTAQLHQRSYELHKQLAEELHIASYRSITTLEVDGSRNGQNVATWLNGKVKSTTTDSNTAQAR
jgi:glycine/D-amino acid oxidase-like deaminating enzyme